MGEEKLLELKKIDDLKPGNELDILVLSKILNCSCKERAMGWNEDGGPQYVFCNCSEAEHMDFSNNHGAAISPSTDTKGIELVCKAMAEKGYTCHIEYKGKGRVYANTAEVMFVRQIWTAGHAVGDEIAEAVCKAALKTLISPPPNFKFDVKD